MWADEINDPEYQDPQEDVMYDKPKRKVKGVPDYRELYYQPITSLRKNILNAITGEKTKYLIGTKDEGRFFCIMTQDPYDPKESCRLFFSSPRDYEQFTGIKVSEERIRKFWEAQEQFVDRT
jgi:hypothetical protein